ncbi:MAG: 3-isopropylmalate dehydratase small subunit [Alphaproteobacteria bacterium]
MQPFTNLTGIAAPLPMINVDTDMIIPKQFLKTIKRSGLGVHLFDEMRFDEQGNEIADFVLNTDPYRDAEILIAGDNFGCGSSREHAPWALLDFGIRCVIAPSYADIFYNNCFKNGILPLILPQEQVDALMEDAKSGNSCRLKVDLEAQTVTRANGDVISFQIDPFRRKCLLEGLDDIGLTLQHETDITGFEDKRAGDKPWLSRKGTASVEG